MLVVLDSVGQGRKFLNVELCDSKAAMSEMQDKQETEWKQKLLTKPKLCFYAAIKDSLNVEKYVCYNLSPGEHSITAQLRFGILPLEIEIG